MKNPETESLLPEIQKRFSYKQEWLRDWEAFYCEPNYTHSLVTDRPCVLIGSRGSGKTTTLRSLSYAARKVFLGSRASDLDEWSHFGIFERVETTRTSIFSGPELHKEHWSQIFSHFLNLVFSKKLVELLLELQTDFRVSFEFTNEDSRQAKHYLGLDKEPSGLQELKAFIETSFWILEEKINNIGDEKIIQTTTLGQPIKWLCNLLRRPSELAGKSIFILVDEYENFTESQQRVFNTLIKHCAPDYSIKIGVRDYGFRTKETLANSEFLSHPADYVAVRVYDEFEKRSFRMFSKNVIASRLRGIPQLVGRASIFEALTLEEEFLRQCPESIRQGVEKIWKEVRLNDRKLKYPSDLFRYFSVESCIHRSIDAKCAPAWISKSLGTLEQNFGNYRYAAVLAASKKIKADVKKLYCGESMLADLSGKNIRYFMEIVQRSLINEINRSGTIDCVSAEAQTAALLRAGEEYLKDLEVRGLMGRSVSKLVLGIGAVFEALARQVFGGRPETTQFEVVHDHSTSDQIAQAEKLLEAGVRHGAFLEEPLTKPEGPGAIKDKEFMIFPLICPFLGISHRKKRRMRIHAHELVTLSSDPDEGRRVVLRRIGRSDTWEDSERDLFDD